MSGWVYASFPAAIDPNGEQLRYFERPRSESRVFRLEERGGSVKRGAFHR